jgi:hypothetical protein
VGDQNIPEIKKFIGSYVEKVIVYKEYVEVILKFHVVDKSKSTTSCGRGFTWWRRGEPSPCPKASPQKLLRV